MIQNYNKYNKKSVEPCSWCSSSTSDVMLFTLYSGQQPASRSSLVSSRGRPSCGNMRWLRTGWAVGPGTDTRLPRSAPAVYQSIQRDNTNIIVMKKQSIIKWHGMVALTASAPLRSRAPPSDTVYTDTCCCSDYWTRCKPSGPLHIHIAHSWDRSDSYLRACRSDSDYPRSSRNERIQRLNQR